jgi:endoglucanase
MDNPTKFDNGVEESERRMGLRDRRDVLKALGASTFAALLPKTSAGLLGVPSESSRSSAPSLPAKNPSWYGFNLLEYFSTDPDWMKYFPYKNDGMFQEDDFRWIRDWGFNWVRLPMDYRFWTDPADFFKIREDKVEPIDRAIRLGEKYGVHVNVCLHRAPGYCILDIMDEKLTGIHVTREKSNAFTDPKTREAFAYQWGYFAKRYKGVSNEKVSFNLVNEPYDLNAAAEITALIKAGKSSDDTAREISDRFEKQYVTVAKAAIDAIRKEDSERLIVSDGVGAGNLVIPGLFDANVLHSCHTYTPMPLTHYQCEWAMSTILNGSEPAPTWPLKDKNGKVVCDRAVLENQFHPWGELAAKGVPIHFGEMGCYKHTPPDVMLAWYGDTLGAIRGLNSGFALWNFRGPFGVLDTERPGTKFEDWHGHKLDRALLTLLQQKMKS